MAVNGVQGRKSIGVALKQLFSFPHPVNEVSARVVAGMVVALTLVIILTDIRWLMFPLAYGFLARVLTGPKLSLMGLLATRVIVPKIIKRSRMVAGPPKRFAQTVGLGFSVTAIVLSYVVGVPLAAKVVLGVLLLFASLESFVGFCAGCFVFGYLMRWGLVPMDVCEKCSNVGLSPNPPMRSGLGVGTRGEGRGTRRSALDSDKWGRWRPLVGVGGADGGPGQRRWGGVGGTACKGRQSRTGPVRLCGVVE